MNTTQQPEAPTANHPEQPLEMAAHWYMVDKDGMATLCADREDAEREAQDANGAWPHTRPHRALQLVDAQQLAHAMGTRQVLCDLLEECMPVIEELLKFPGDDKSDAHLYGLISRIKAAQAAVAEEALEGCKA